MSTLSTFIKRLRDIMRNDAGVNGDAQRIEQIAWMLFLKVYDSKEEDWELDEDDYKSILPDDCRWCNWAHDDGSGRVPTGDTLLNFVNNRLFPALKTLPVTADTPVKKAVVQSVFQDANNYMKDGVLLRQVVNVIDELDLNDYEEVHAFGEIYETLLHELQSAGSSGEFYTPRAVTQFMARRVKPKIGDKMADLACGTGGFITSFLGELEPQIKTTDDQEKYSTSIYGIEKKQFPYILCVTNLLLHGIDEPNVYHGNALTIHNLLDYTVDEGFDVLLMNPPYGGNEKNDVKNYFPADLASSETADLFLDVMMYRLKPGGRAGVVVPDGFLFGTDNAKLNIKKKLLKDFNLHTVVRLPGSVFSPYTSITTNLLFFDRTGPTQQTWFYRLDMPEGYKHFSKTKPMKLNHFDPVEAWWDDRQEIAVDGFDKAKLYTAAQLADELGYNFDQCGFPHEEEEILDPMDLILRYQEERASLNAEVDYVLTNIRSKLNDENISPRLSGQKSALSRLVEIDRRFPTDMQKSILQLAIQGKLVEQRPEEGTSEELYRQIQAEKQSLIRSGKLKKEKTLPEISEDEIPFDIPESWKWVRLGDTSWFFDAGKSPNCLKQPVIDDEWGVITTTAIQLGYFDDKQNKILPAGFVAKETMKVKSGDILITRAGPTNRTGIACLVKKIGYNLILSDKTLRINMTDRYVYKDYIVMVLNSPQIRELIIELMSGMDKQQVNISQDKYKTLPIPLPPLAEQKRIVAKLEELLPLCERLK